MKNVEQDRDWSNLLAPDWREPKTDEPPPPKGYFNCAGRYIPAPGEFKTEPLAEG